MSQSKPGRVFIAPSPLQTAFGGPGTFARTLATSLTDKGIEVHWGCDNTTGAGDSVLVINGTRSILPLLRARWRGAKIVQRLGVPPRTFFSSNPRLRRSLHFRIMGWLINFIRTRVASHIVYQSNYAKKCWYEASGIASSPESVILNGVNTKEFRPGTNHTESEVSRLIVVEGNVGVEAHGLEMMLSDELAKRHANVAIEVYGDVDDETKLVSKSRPNLEYKGRISRRELASTMRGATACLLTDVVTSASPNSLIEAMASGVPGLAYDYGPAAEIITGNSGILVPIDGDPANGHSPDNIDKLADALQKIIDNYPEYSAAARSKTVTDFDSSAMANQYIEVLSGS